MKHKLKTTMTGYCGKEPVQMNIHRIGNSAQMKCFSVLKRNSVIKIIIIDITILAMDEKSPLNCISGGIYKR
jgi:hypothetical protein